jgi:hypothetical protein
MWAPVSGRLCWKSIVFMSGDMGEGKDRADGLLHPLFSVLSEQYSTSNILLLVAVPNSPTLLLLDSKLFPFPTSCNGATYLSYSTLPKSTPPLSNGCPPLPVNMANTWPILFPPKINNPPPLSTPLLPNTPNPFRLPIPRPSPHPRLFLWWWGFSNEQLSSWIQSHIFLTLPPPLHAETLNQQPTSCRRGTCGTSSRN